MTSQLLSIALTLAGLALALAADSAHANMPSPLSDSPNGPLRVTIDPGHGGSDTGASRGHLKESEIALKVSLKLAELLKQDPRFNVSLTRSDDHKVTLSRRVKIAEDAKSDLFISVHLNSSTESRAHGTEIYFQNQLPADEEAMYLVSREHEDDETMAPTADTAAAKNEPLSTKTDLKRILEDLHRNHRIATSSEIGKTLLDTLIAKGAGQKLGSRAIRQAPFHVVSYTTVPSVLVELGFITNPQEGPRLAQADYQNELARTLYEGLAKFKETVDKDARETLKSQASLTTR